MGRFPRLEKGVKSSTFREYRHVPDMIWSALRHAYEKLSKLPQTLWTGAFCCA
ncbi:hypothetical protein B932_0648 [Gluconobacter oxydans H24]|nr:hypothetical protein B932_0648 [Gluconobacter oxydans H24]